MIGQVGAKCMERCKPKGKIDYNRIYMHIYAVGIEMSPFQERWLQRLKSNHRRGEGKTNG